METLDLNQYKSVEIYKIVEELLAIGQMEKVVTMSTQEGNIAIYNTKDGNICYIGYIDMETSQFIQAEITDDEKTDK